MGRVDIELGREVLRGGGILVKDLTTSVLLLGEPKGTAVVLGDGSAGYQSYAVRTVFWSADFGSHWISPAAFAKWQALASQKTSAGGNVRDYLGVPISDEFRVKGKGSAVYFERGLIALRRDGNAFVVYGAIYAKYRDLGDVQGWIGFPVSDEEALGVGGRRSRFDAADICWHGDSGAHEVHGAIRDKWYALGGPAGVCGMPLSDELPAMRGTQEIGRFNNFTGASIYWSANTGAWEVHGDIRRAWLDRFGGPAGALGFPVGDETSTPSGRSRYNNFAAGVIVWPGSYERTQAFTSLDLFVNSFAGKGSHGIWEDLGAASIDLYVKVDLQARSASVPGGAFVNQGRMPAKGEYGSTQNIGRDLLPVISPPRGDLVISAKFTGYDSRTIGKDTDLGAVSCTYTADDMFGTNDVGRHLGRDFAVDFAVRSSAPFDPRDVRGQMFWQFRNVHIANLTWDQFARTFRDVDESEKVWTHPFDHTFYQVVYKDLGAAGTCFGMCLEALYARFGQSVYAEPIHGFQDSLATRDSIAIKHGYQLGAEAIDYIVRKFVAGGLCDPVRAFEESHAFWNAGNPAVLALTSGFFKVGGHVVLPYRWEKVSGTRWEIWVANPNTPTPAPDDSTDSVIVVNPETNTFEYRHGGTSTWKGGFWSGGRMYPVPYSVLSSQPRTPGWEVAALLAGATLFLLGADATTEQISDDLGRTLFQADPLRLATRVPNFDVATRTRLALPLERVQAVDVRLSHLPDLVAAFDSSDKFASNVPRAADVISSATPGARDLGYRNVVTEADRVPGLAPLDALGLLPGVALADSAATPELYLHRPVARLPDWTAAEQASIRHKLTVADIDTSLRLRLAAAEGGVGDAPPPAPGDGRSAATLAKVARIISDADATRAVAAQARRAGAPARRLHHSVRSRDGATYEWSMTGPAMSVAAQIAGRTGVVDTISADVSGARPTVTVVLSGDAVRKASLTLAGFALDATDVRRFEIANLLLADGQSITAGLDESGDQLVLASTGPDLHFDLRLYVSAATSPVLVLPGVQLAAGTATAIKPPTWDPTAITTSLVQMALTDGLRGRVLSTVTLHPKVQ